MIINDEYLLEYFDNKRVIVVGNSSSILSHKYNENFYIDNHDIVIRMNFAFPRQELFFNMGNKTNILVLNFISKNEQMITANRYNNFDFILRLRCSRENYNDIPDGYGFDYKLVDNYDVYLWDKMNYYSEECGEYKMLKEFGFQPSTGFMLLYFIHNHINNFKSLEIIGFDFLTTSNPVFNSSESKERLFGFQEKIKLGYGFEVDRFHDVEKEKKFILDLVRNDGRYIFR